MPLVIKQQMPDELLRPADSCLRRVLTTFFQGCTAFYVKQILHPP